MIIVSTALVNWQVGWALVLAGFLTGAGLGLGFHRPEFLGGYGSFRRRLFRLGHIACVALGALNVLYALSAPPGAAGDLGALASLGWVAGGVCMPVGCFLTGWRQRLRLCLAVPVVALVIAATATLLAGLPCPPICRP
jgi:hypothetical protein